jgi:hypothetical protein
MEMLEIDHFFFFFLMFSRIGLCVSLKFLFFFQANGVAGFGGLNLF